MIRKTLDTDIPAVMAIYDAARAFMRAHGNTTQWPEGTPSGEQLAADIAAGGSYVCEEDGRVVATFAFLPGPDSSYDVIEGGQWRSDAPYAVLHRVGIRRHHAWRRGCDVCLCRGTHRPSAYRHTPRQPAHAGRHRQGRV